MKHQFNFVQYANPVTPEFVEQLDQQQPWVRLGQDNLYPHYLETLLAGSAMHGAIVKGVADMIYGKGLVSEHMDDHTDQYLKLKDLLHDSCLRRMAYDLKLYGQCYVQVIYSVDRSKIAETHHMPAACIRAGQQNDEGLVDTYYYSNDWTDSRNPGFEPQVIPAFSAQDRTAASQLLHIKGYSSIGDYYGVPDYLGSTRYIELDRDISELYLSSIKSGLFPSLVISFNNGVPTDEERIEMERLLYDKFGGATNAGKFLMTFNDSQDNAPTIETLQAPDVQKTYEFMAEEVMAKILSGHRVTSPLLFGLRDTGGGFGSNADEMRDAYDLFTHTVIKPFQSVLLDGLRPLLSVNSIVLPVEFGVLQPATFLDLDAKAEAPAQQHNFSKPKRISETQGDVWLNRLKFAHAGPNPNWVLVKQESVGDTNFDRRLHTRRNFAESSGTLASYDRHTEGSDWGDVIGPDGTMFAVRYMYSQNDSTSESKTGVSRDFCQKMVALSEDGVMYRYEDIADMSDDGINNEFAAAGASTYDIFEWKGGTNCYHGWVRLVFAAQEDNLSPEELESKWDDVMQRVGNNPYVEPVGIEAVRPIDMQ